MPKPVYYSQKDSMWKNIMFSNHNDQNQTIGSSGCGATSFAMIAATWIDHRITPVDVAKVILDNGYRTYNSGVDWGFFKFAGSYYKIDFKQTDNTEDAIDALKHGALIVASMKKGYFTRFGHYILLWGLDEVNKKILCHDPNSTERKKASYDLFKKECANYFIFYRRMRRVADKSLETWKLELGIQALKDLSARGLINDPQEHIPVMQRSSEDSLDWLTLVIIDRLAEKLGVKKEGE